jgi:hypothetical protein
MGKFNYKKISGLKTGKNLSKLIKQSEILKKKLGVNITQYIT